MCLMPKTCNQVLRLGHTEWRVCNELRGVEHDHSMPEGYLRKHSTAVTERVARAMLYDAARPQKAG